MSWVAAAVVGGAVIGGATSVIGANKAAGASKDATQASIAEQARQYDTARADYQPYRDVGRGALTSLSKIYGLESPGEDRSIGSKAYNEAFADYYSRQGPAVKTGSKEFDKLVRGFEDIWQKGQLTGRYGQGAPASGYQQQADGKYGPAPAAPGTPATGTGGAAAGADRYAGFFQSPGYQFNLDEGNRAIAANASSRGKVFSGDALKATSRFTQGMASNEWGNYVNGIQSLAGVGQSATGSTVAAGANAANNNSNAYLNHGNVVGSSYMAGAQGVNNAVQGGMGNFLLHKYLQTPAGVPG